MQTLTIIISTMNDKIRCCENATRIQHPNIRYLIVHQNHNNTPIPNFLIREDISIIPSKTKGLAKSRNIGIENCETKYALIADDDVEYIEEGLLKVLETINQDNLDFATFKIKTPKDSPEYKNYYNKETIITLPFFHWFSSIEILLNTHTLRYHKIHFDERFGLGTLLKKGEEQILIKDLLSQSTTNTGKFFPIYLVKHPYESSGKKKLSEMQEYFIYGATLQRLNQKDNRNCHQYNLLRKAKITLAKNIGKLYISLTNFIYK